MSLSNYKNLDRLDPYSRIYKAIDSINNREVVIKKIRSNSDSIREVEYHKKLSRLSFIPKLYQIFIENEYTYIVMESITSFSTSLQDTSLINSWIRNKNWNHYWTTTLYALQVINELHRSGFYHGDLHLGNLIWTGEKMYVIDFETMDAIDYNCSMLRQHIINNKIRSDYDYILNYRWIDKDVKGDCKRYQLLVDFSKKMPCEGFYQGEYVNDSDYIRRVIEEYHRIDQLIF